jgi:hypothetical protein
LAPDAWSPHPNGDAGNDAVRLISVDGGDNEEVNGLMRMTAHLERSPYLRQILASFGVVSLYGEEPAGRPEFERLRDGVREQSRVLAPGLIARANRVAAHRVLEAHILSACLYADRR